MKRFIAVLLVTGSILNPLHIHAASQESVDEAQFSEQLTALTKYVRAQMPHSYTTPLSSTELADLISTGSAWIVAAQEDSGHFAYEYVPYEDTYLDDDNIVRQGGALFALGELKRNAFPTPAEVDEVMVRALAYFESISKEGTYHGASFRCVARNQVSKTCPLGATSLVLIGMLSYVAAHPDRIDTYEDLISDYRAFIYAMQKENGGFITNFRVGAARQNDAESPFSNGEALLALVRLYEYEQHSDVRNAIDRAFTYLKAEPYDTALYLWIMAALVDMHALWGNEEYVSYAQAFTNWRVDAALRFRQSPRNYCAYTEGVASAYRLLAPHIDESERQDLRAERDYWNQKNSTLQITADDTYRVITQTSGTLTLRKLEQLELARGGFLTAHDVPTQRIDFTQHCVNAYLQTYITQTAQ